MFNNILSKIKEKIQKINKKVNLKNIAVIALIVACFFAFNLGGLLSNVFTSITNLTNELGEMKKIVLQSPGYEGQEGGSYQITKIVNWTAADTASLEFDIKTIAETEGFEKDIVFILDTSASMEGTRIDTLKEALKTTIPTILEKNINNKIGLIRFSSDSTILNELTNDEESLINSIDSLEAIGDTNYYSAFVNLRSMLSDYREVSGRELVVVFVTDGAPNVSTPNQKSEYALFKVEHPYATVYGVPYYSGINNTISELSDVTDEVIGYNEYLSLADRLIKASLMPEDYEEFTISEYIDSDYFNVTTNDIKVSMGNIKITNEAGSQKVTWTIPSGEFKSGDSLSMTINLKVQSDKLRKPGLYTTSTKTEASLKLPSSEAKTINSTEVNSLRSGYNVIYDANAPQGCNASFNLTEVKYAFDTVTLSSEQPSCSGYEFKGWQVVSDVQMINDDNFIMPDNNIQIKGTWTQLAINKTMEGDVYEKLTLYKTIERQAVPDNIKSEYVTSVTGINFKNSASDTNGKGVYTVASTLNDTYPVHYFRGDIDNNHVLFGGFCWRIIRTTDTGGVKLIYDGKPTTDGVCNNTGVNTVIDTNGDGILNYNDDVDYNVSGDASYITEVGYMYNPNAMYEEVNFRSRPRKDIDIPVNRTTSVTNSNYYYSTLILYRNGKYSLVNPVQMTWESNYDKLPGYYTCFSTSATGTCTNINYILEDSTSTRAVYFSLYGGGGINGADTYYTLGKGYTKNANGTYTLTDTQSVYLADWYDTYDDYEDMYMCSDHLSTTCSELWLISSTFSTDFYAYSTADNITMGKSYTYNANTKRYRLTNYVTGNMVENPNAGGLSYAYTCGSTSTTCSTLYIMTSYNRGEFDAYQGVPLTNGKNITDLLNEMLWSKQSNTSNSNAKTVVDNWYRNNMTNYTKFIEDTIYCNDRSICNLGYWKEGSVKAYDDDVDFCGYQRDIDGKPDLSCSSQLDSFTVSSSLGNGKLTYPSALLTHDEYIYSGDSNSFIQTVNSWQMTPHYVLSGDLVGVYIGNYSTWLHFSEYIRPVISLKPDIEYSYGNGTSENPYVIAVD